MLADREFGLACLAIQIRDALMLPVRSITDQRMNFLIRYVVIIAVRV